MGDVFPRLDSAFSFAHVDKQHPFDGIERGHGLLSPVFEDVQSRTTPSDPALVVHVDIRFTDPVIRSRYYRSYESSPEFNATTRICRGLVRRIERCAEEFVTRKDSTALELFKRDSFDRKPQRYEMTFRVARRGKGEWAERTYRSYQKQPLTIAHTRDVVLATHRIVGLFLLRHDRNFRWLDCLGPDAGLPDTPETAVPSRGGPPSLLCVPQSRFIEATQAFEFVPGYDIHISFRSTNPHRQIPAIERNLKVSSTQTAPLTLFMSEDLLRKAQQVVNDELAQRWCQVAELPIPFRDDALEIGIRVVNNLGRQYDHVCADMTSTLPLFRDDEGRDCDAFLSAVEQRLAQTRNDADSALNATNDLEFRIVELKGVGWILREPAHFTVGPSISHGQQTIQAALDRLQTGVGDVIRGHNLAIHIKAQKRGHVVLDKAIVAHEKRGKPLETFSSREDEQAIFVARLKARVQADMDKIFQDSCCIDDIPEEEEDYFVRSVTPVTPVQLEQAIFDGPSRDHSPCSVRSCPPKPARQTSFSGLHLLPRPRSQRVFSLSSRSTESVRSIDYLKPGRYTYAESDISRPSTAGSEQMPRRSNTPSPVPDRGPVALERPVRAFSLGSKRSTTWIRPGNASTLAEQSACGAESSGPIQKDSEGALQISVASHETRSMTSLDGEGISRAASSTITLESASLVSLEVRPAAQNCEPSPQNTTIKATTPVAGQPKQIVMNTPEFVDAREYPTSPEPQEIAAVKAELTTALSSTLSPRDDDEYSTAPTTPELSVGASSMGYDVATTPVLMRTTSEAKDNILMHLCPESEQVEDPETVPVRLQPESTADAEVSNDRLTTPSFPSKRDRGDSEDVVPLPTAAPDDGDAVAHPRPPIPDPAARATPPLHEETQSDALPHAAAPSDDILAVSPATHNSHDDSGTSTAVCNSPTLQEIIKADKLISELVAPTLGTESTIATSEDNTHHVPELALDLPTPQVRTPNLDTGAAAAAESDRDTDDADRNRDTSSDSSALADELGGGCPVAESAIVESLGDDAVSDTVVSGPERAVACPGGLGVLGWNEDEAEEGEAPKGHDSAAVEALGEDVAAEAAGLGPEVVAEPGGKGEAERIGDKAEKEGPRYQGASEDGRSDDAGGSVGGEEVHLRTWAEVAAAGTREAEEGEARTLPSIEVGPGEETEDTDRDVVGVGLGPEMDEEWGSESNGFEHGSEDVRSDAVGRVDGEDVHPRTCAEVTAAGNRESETVDIAAMTVPAAEAGPVEETEDVHRGPESVALVPEMDGDGISESSEGTGTAPSVDIGHGGGEGVHPRTWAEVAAAGIRETEAGDAGTVPSIEVGPGEGTKDLDRGADDAAFVPEVDAEESLESSGPGDGAGVLQVSPEKGPTVEADDVLGSDHAVTETSVQSESRPSVSPPDTEVAEGTKPLPAVPDEPTLEPNHAATETTVKSESESSGLDFNAEAAETELPPGVPSEPTLGSDYPATETTVESESGSPGLGPDAKVAEETKLCLDPVATGGEDESAKSAETMPAPPAQAEEEANQEPVSIESELVKDVTADLETEPATPDDDTSQAKDDSPAVVAAADVEAESIAGTVSMPSEPETKLDPSPVTETEAIPLDAPGEQTVGAALESVGSGLEDENPLKEGAVADGPGTDPIEDAAAIDGEDHHYQIRVTGERQDKSPQPISEVAPSQPEESSGLEEAGEIRVHDGQGSVPPPESDTNLIFDGLVQGSEQDIHYEAEGSGSAPTGLGIVEPEIRGPCVEVELDAAGKIETSAADNVPGAAEPDAIGPESPDSGVAGMDKEDPLAILSPIGNEARGVDGGDKSDLTPLAAEQQESGGELASAASGSPVSDIDTQISSKEPEVLGQDWDSAGKAAVDGTSADFEVVDDKTPRQLTSRIGGDEASKPSEQTLPNSGAGLDGGASEKTFGPEGRVLQPASELTAPEIAEAGLAESSFTIPSPPSKPDEPAPVISADGSATPPATPKLAEPATPPHHRQNSIPHLAPVPDISKLADLYPITPESPISLRSFDASRSTTTITTDTQPRDSVDSIRSIVEEQPQPKQQPHHLSASQPPPKSIPSTRSSSPANRRLQTTGYLGVGLGLGLGLGLGPKGLAQRRSYLDLHGGALDDNDDESSSACRRVSLLLHSPKLRQGGVQQKHRQPDGEELRDKGVARLAGSEEPGTAAGGISPRDGGVRVERKRMKKKEQEGDHEDDGLSADSPVLPRMMVLLAGAVAVGKILSGPG
ncbi:hypothetical protein VTJ49DRAFT_2332 [Mycothermus thermophilus]|uniref:Pt repeat family protein n=1 Tax=Humicola insolens TaxID=85995 RepID=A0ABR3VQT2_HUMIN